MLFSKISKLWELWRSRLWYVCKVPEKTCFVLYYTYDNLLTEHFVNRIEVLITVVSFSYCIQNLFLNMSYLLWSTSISQYLIHDVPMSFVSQAVPWPVEFILALAKRYLAKLRSIPDQSLRMVCFGMRVYSKHQPKSLEYCLQHYIVCIALILCQLTIMRPKMIFFFMH